MDSALKASHAGAASVRSVGKTYGNGDRAVAALAGVDLEIADGEFIAVVGASGCGKSTILRILAGFEEPTEGEILMGGKPVLGPHPERGVVFQDYALFPWLTVRENVAYGPRRCGASRAGSVTTADRLIEMVGLSRFSTKYPRELSGGMQQRVAIARVLANDPALLLMDEPFGALDALTRSRMQQELMRIHQTTGTSVLFVTHSIEEAIFLADRVVVMSGGASHGVPGHIEVVVPIDLPDRDVTSPAFNTLKRIIAQRVHAEQGAAVE